MYPHKLLIAQRQQYRKALTCIRSKQTVRLLCTAPYRNAPDKLSSQGRMQAHELRTLLIHGWKEMAESDGDEDRREGMKMELLRLGDSTP